MILLLKIAYCFVGIIIILGLVGAIITNYIDRAHKRRKNE